jgi:AcrR family transcriptional regulator
MTDTHSNAMAYGRNADAREHTRIAIVETAARILKEHGAAAVTTRGVATAAGVQAPVIYRLFGDKDGLLDAVAEHVLTAHVAATAALGRGRGQGIHRAPRDPIAALRAGWDMQVEFGLENPELFARLNLQGPGAHSPATAQGIDVLRTLVGQVAAAGRLRVSERWAVDVLHAAGSGAVLALLGMPTYARDLELADTLFDAVAREILTDVPAAPDGGPVAAAVAFRTAVPGLKGLTDTERTLMVEWLDRAIAQG